jgi:hypothetical protein
MATFIKTGFWEKRTNPPQGYKGELNLEQLIQQNASGGSIATSGTSLYSTNPLAGPGFSTDGGIFFGYDAGNDAENTSNSTFLGNNAGSGASNAFDSNFLGYQTGQDADNASYSNFIGSSAGFEATNASYSNFLGKNAGYEATNANNSNFFGLQAGLNSTGNNVNAFGANAGSGNALNGQTIFSNASMPSFADHTAAAAAITVLLGASAGSTYLYHNQATNSIGAVRL